jgi:hypothetical protein
VRAIRVEEDRRHKPERDESQRDGATEENGLPARPVGVGVLAHHTERCHEMAVNTTTASLTRPRRRPHLVGAASRATVRLLASIQNVLDGSSFEPGRHSLTRVQEPGTPQEPR